MMIFPTTTPHTVRKSTSKRKLNNDNTSLPPEKMRNRQRKSRVSFNNIVTVTTIESHRSYSFTERLSYWYSNPEVRCFKLQENIRNLKMKREIRKSNSSKNLQQNVAKAQSLFQELKNQRNEEMNKKIIDFKQKSACVTSKLQEKSAIVTNKLQTAFARVRENRSLSTSTRSLGSVKLRLYRK